ncbi:ABC transporter permease [Mesorhizobium sp. SARCC-RB16n]|uniref:ABC transporter permease n=1 Tax=Mesorhizobium sp. SARCC-RB16n TaxID=2116687 RepID=UPI00122F0542|nr:ABC transporter permease [Mesorhizobium sp. SARCC-RB16n]KAA3448188.1 ABC transporter permease [Mesorhizobium sp. SARCC-RB16n]
MTDIIDDPLQRRYRAVGTALAVSVYVFLLSPLVITIPMAFGTANTLTFPPTEFSLDLFRTFFNSPGWVNPLLNSIKIALATTSLSLFAGTLAAYWLVRREFLGRALITGVIMSPLIVPSVISGLGLYLYFSYFRINSSTLSIVLGHIMVVLPFVVVMIMAGMNKLDRNLEFGAELMGAGTIRMFVTVVLPQLVPSLVSAALFAFLSSFDEFILSWFLSGPDTITLPVRMYNALNWEVSPVIAAVSTLMMALSLVVCVAAISLRKATPADG